jgi:hypothetical protein
VNDSDVHVPAMLSHKYLNSQAPSGFTDIQNIKRPAKGCIPDHHWCDQGVGFDLLGVYSEGVSLSVEVSRGVCNTEVHRQNITWKDGEYTSLEVHTGAQGLGRTLVTHAMLREVFRLMLADIRKDLESTEVPLLEITQFEQLRDSSTSTHAGEGLGTFNHLWSVEDFVQRHELESFRLIFLQKAAKIMRLCACLVYMSGGPSPRGTEVAVTRLLNSQTEQQRNVLLIDGTIGVQSG